MLVYDILQYLERVVMYDLSLAVREHVDKGALRLDLSSLIQQALKEIFKGVLD